MTCKIAASAQLLKLKGSQRGWRKDHILLFLPFDETRTPSCMNHFVEELCPITFIEFILYDLSLSSCYPAMYIFERMSCKLARRS